ncbi:hypothetical protein [Streptomyces sp. NBRC 109706]|uniref:hypothetical protein n=1 Tax=Streptomyces sp. NBRC 109706 TaxID=1550035 RepID=UPI000782803B|nr:hypothetical protein [Streptomyces sp. NBRC 109706]
MRYSIRHHLLMAAAFLVSAAIAVWAGVGLDSYAVPASLTFPVATAVFASVFGLTGDLAGRASAVTHRCPECGLTIHLTGTTREESQRLRETISRHPHRL